MPYIHRTWNRYLLCLQIANLTPRIMSISIGSICIATATTYTNARQLYSLTDIVNSTRLDRTQRRCWFPKSCRLMIWICKNLGIYCIDNIYIPIVCSAGVRVMGKYVLSSNHMMSTERDIWCSISFSLYNLTGGAANILYRILPHFPPILSQILNIAASTVDKIYKYLCFVNRSLWSCGHYLVCRQTN